MSQTRLDHAISGSEVPSSDGLDTLQALSGDAALEILHAEQDAELMADAIADEALGILLAAREQAAKTALLHALDVALVAKTNWIDAATVLETAGVPANCELGENFLNNLFAQGTIAITSRNEVCYSPSYAKQRRLELGVSK